MDATKQWHKLREMKAFQKGLDGLLRHSSALWTAEQKDTGAQPELSPSVDISERDEEYVIRADLPDVRKVDIEVSMEAGILTITGEHSLEKREDGKMYLRIKRACTSFSRSFPLPNDVSPNKVSAEFNDGVLTVHLPRNQKAKRQQIGVRDS